MIDLIIIEDNVALADSRVVSAELGIQHGDFFSNVIRKYQEEVENDFGVIRFCNGKPLPGSSGGRPEIYALLTEAQALFFIMVSRNSDQSLKVKKSLVDYFIQNQQDGSTFFDLITGESSIKRETKQKKEKRIEIEFGKFLSDQGILVHHQVQCIYGIADIVTPDAIYEIKATLSRSDIHKATAQVLLYQRCINPKARAIIVGCPCNGDTKVAIELAHGLGVEVIIWKD